MQFKPVSEKELKQASLLPPGIYDCEVVEATNSVSTSGNDMIVLKLKVFDNNGGSRFVRDFLLEKMAYKLRHAAVAFKLSDEYEKGELIASDFVGKTAKCKIRINGEYNNVQDYVVPDKEVQVGPLELDDTIPFN